MTRIEANTLQEAYLNAAKEFECSITELEIEVIQNSASGFLGMFKKTAIVKVRKKNSGFNEKAKNNEDRKNRSSKKTKEESQKQNQVKNVVKLQNHKIKKEATKKQETKIKKNIVAPKKSQHVEVKEEVKRTIRREPKKQVLKIDIDKAIAEISTDINKLFENSCFEMDAIKVSKFNDDTILIEFGGEDSALLIGKEGYRYKALSYLLYNWINIKYGANIRLEIAEFLKNQEEMIGKYLIPVIERVRNNGRGQTKILDGVLIKIALEKLRAQFPEKYVGIKSGREGGRFIVVNDFNRKAK